jgi:hypothetical protein
MDVDAWRFECHRERTLILTDIYPLRIYDEIGHSSNSPKTFAISSSGFNGL